MRRTKTLPPAAAVSCSWAEARDHVYPLMVPAAVLQGIELERVSHAPPRGPLPAATFVWHGDLAIICVLDRPTDASPHWIDQALLDAWQTPAEQILEQAKANLTHCQMQAAVGRTPAGTRWVQLEPTIYTAACALLPALPAVLADHLGPVFDVMLPAGNLLLAYTTATPWADDDLAEVIFAAIAEDADPGNRLPILGALAINLLAGTITWRQLRQPPRLN